MTSVGWGSITKGQVIYTVTDLTYGDTGIIPGTEITGFGTGTGGIGTYTVNKQQNTNLSGLYIIASPKLNGLVPINQPYSTGLGDNRGVSSDIFGNIWYLSTNAYDSPPTYNTK